LKDSFIYNVFLCYSIYVNVTFSLQNIQREWHLHAEYDITCSVFRPLSCCMIFIKPDVLVIMIQQFMATLRIYTAFSQAQVIEVYHSVITCFCRSTLRTNHSLEPPLSLWSISLILYLYSSYAAIVYVNVRGS